MTKLWLLSANPLAAPRFSSRFLEQGAAPPLTAGILAVLYLLWVLMSWPPPEAFTEPVIAEPAVPAASPEADSPPDYLEIADWHLFGQPEAAAAQDSTAALASTPLPLKLLGTFLLAGAPENSYAIIQAGDGVQQKYRVGQALPEDAVLQGVEKTRVVLKHMQRLEALEFDPNPVSLVAPNP